VQRLPFVNKWGCTHNFGLQGSATLSMAYAAALFADSVLRGLNGERFVFVVGAIA
jgi:H+/gluconate symporter-like permease